MYIVEMIMIRVHLKGGLMEIFDYNGVMYESNAFNSLIQKIGVRGLRLQESQRSKAWISARRKKRIICLPGSSRRSVSGYLLCLRC